METTVFGANLAMFRKLRGLTQEELAGKVGVSAQAVSKWENGSYPDGALLPNISKCLDVSLDVLFGLKAQNNVSNKRMLEKNLIEELQKIPEENRIDRILEICYAIICSYHLCSDEVKEMPKKLNIEARGEIKTDNTLARMRLNEDLQYFWVMKIPKNGVNSFARVDDEILELFKILSQEDYLRVIYFFAATKRNYFITKKKLSKIFKYDEKHICQIVDTLNRLGIIWKVNIEMDNIREEVYGYCHNSAFPMLMASAKAYLTYGDYNEQVYENWSQGAFCPEETDYDDLDDTTREFSFENEHN